MDSIDIGFYLSVLKRRLPLLVIVAAIPAFGGLALALSSVPVYRATALVMVVSPRLPAEMARSTVSDSAVGRFHIIERELTTPPSLLALADRFAIHGEDARLTAAKAVEDMRSRLEVGQFWLDPATPAAPAFSIAFEADSPELAADVANHLATTIVDEDSRRRTEGASETMAFFRQDVDRLSAELATIEGRLLVFRNERLDALPDSLDFRRNQQTGQAERLLRLEREESALRSRRFNLSLMFEETDPLPIAVAPTPERQVLASLHAALVNQQAIYTDDSPSIAALKARIEQLQAATAASGEPVPDQDLRAPASELDLQLAEIDEQLESIAIEKQFIAEASAQLAASIAVTPENETGLNVLVRERDNIQSQYNAAVARLAQASTGEQVENDLKGERLVLLEEAPVPPTPVRPKRQMIVLGGIGLGLGGAALLMIALELLNRSIRRPSDLQRSLGMEPLMTLPYITTEGQTVARRTFAIFAVGVLAVAIPVAVMVSLRYGVPLSAILGARSAQSGGGMP